MPFGPSQESPTSSSSTRASGDGCSSEADINKGEHSTAQRHSSQEDEETAAKLEEVAQELRRQYAKLLRSRNTAENIRLEVQAALQQSNNLRGFFRESQHQLISYIRDQGGGNGLDQAAFLSLCEKAIADSDAANAQATTASVLEGKLSSEEYILNEDQLAFARTLDQFLQSTGAWHSAQLDQLHLDDNISAMSQHTPSPTIDPLLASYHDKAGDVGLLVEELADFDIEHQQALGQRALERDQGKAPSEMDSHHERRYKASRATLEKRLGDAIAATEDAKKQYFVTKFGVASSLPDMALEDFALPEPFLNPKIPEQHHIFGHDENSVEASSPTDAAEHKQGRVLEWASHIHEVAAKPTIRPVTNEGVDGISPSFLVTQEDVEAMHRIDLDKWGFIHVQRPRRNSSLAWNDTLSGPLHECRTWRTGSSSPGPTPWLVIREKNKSSEQRTTEGFRCLASITMYRRPPHLEQCFSLVVRKDAFPRARLKDLLGSNAYACGAAQRIDKAVL
ncbi:hypothetical protein CERZMDRAFT_82345 [Cercospora zeae-maydis SCOH1-5]|uniref:Uncharacterized protein n=1 Tax=Cercospora zeae-maydis SCOH1-5 TaxID=717836 RepID=A0A6A6FPC1_9PEZI|nr:hypothetical protein CERZMDRAFT_82345 [Cercospora zeae-maydis SCOH1-5]